MNEQERVKTVEKFVCSVLKDDRTGHDLEHVFRVRRLSLYLAVREGGNREIIELSALLHDCADPKLVSSEEEAYKRIDELLRACEVPTNDVNHIIHIIKTVSFKGGNEESPTTIEGKIVQDADRLDAIGAIGIARAFTYGGAKGHVLFKEDEMPRTAMTEDEYRHNPSSVIGHFYEKLLLLKGKMNTKKAVELATDRHRFMRTFLEKFKEEWNGTNEDANS
ncbi:HD domain-containing protein [Priestia filamentosa]|uniref:HD domain-containing protein n=1 Tax=Priestia filamentosa TaxID=1402861 RepID=UPI000A0911EB|nr:HD domain-containing protein [Priestia filamentosa]MDT3761834.1 HD domain-containing protein [Priestia filamentosa]OXS67924.1 phosphohydrolase [Priestia filamentosa]WRU96344.1 HD domain-containing protein [Priestia filamentosa]SMF45924.1 uncharacterized protein SAMN06296056_103358 [Priestia filamentosa]